MDQSTFDRILLTRKRQALEAPALPAGWLSDPQRRGFFPLGCLRRLGLGCG